MIDTKLINATGHTLNFFDNDKITNLFSQVSEGTIRVTEQNQQMPNIGDISFIKKIYLGVEIPLNITEQFEYENNTVVLIVSMFAKNAITFLREKGELILPNNVIVASPDTGDGGVRNDAGQIIGTTRLVL